MNWLNAEISKIANVVSGFGFPREYQGKSDLEIPFYKVDDMNLPENQKEMTIWRNTISNEIAKKLRIKTFPAGTIIFPKIGAAIATDKKRKLTHQATFDNNIMGLVPKSQIDSSYLYYWLLTLNLADISNKGPVPSIRKTTIERINLKLPTPSEQNRIVEILDQADTLRKKRAETDKIAKQIIPALFYKMFGDPKKNAYKFSTDKLGNIVRLKSGISLTANKMAFNGKFPVYGGNGITGYHYKYIFESPKIVIGRVGAYCGIVHYTEPFCWITDNALYVNDFKKKINGYFLYSLLQIMNLNQYAGRAGQPLVSGNRLYPLDIILPPIDLQINFAERRMQIEKSFKFQNETKHKIEILFNVLISKAFSGELTAEWREAHMKELLEEMEIQAKYLETDPSPSLP